LKLLLDTHTLLWFLADSPKLSGKARRAIAGASTVYVSAATAWEISIKKARGKLKAPDDLEKEMLANRLEPLPVTVAHALAAGELPFHHHDPFDRVLIAQAQAESLTLVSADRSFGECGVRVLKL
jgi:PIN domain nuclease of toxin-antitoxin system